MALVARSLSHDSATTYSPAMHMPVTNRIRAQLTGVIQSEWTSTAPDAPDARAANTRMCPTRASRYSADRLPARNPTK